MSSYQIPAIAVKPGSTVIPVRRSLSTRWISVLTLVALVAIWLALTATGMIEPLFLPPPSAVLQKGWLLVTSGYMDSTLWQHLGASLSRIGLGLGFAGVFSRQTLRDAAPEAFGDPVLGRLVQALG